MGGKQTFPTSPKGRLRTFPCFRSADFRRTSLAAHAGSAAHDILLSGLLAALAQRLRPQKHPCLAPTSQPMRVVRYPFPYEEGQAGLGVVGTSVGVVGGRQFASPASACLSLVVEDVSRSVPVQSWGVRRRLLNDMGKVSSPSTCPRLGDPEREYRGCPAFKNERRSMAFHPPISRNAKICWTLREGGYRARSWSRWGS